MDIALFDFEGNQVRTLEIDGEPWFVAKDVTDLLGFKNGARDVQRHVSAGQSRRYRIGMSESATGFQDMTIINEPGLYRLIMRSNVPGAERFQDWVTAEVLPTIRKTRGAYIAPGSQAEADLLNPDTMLEKFGELLSVAKGERAKRVEAEARNVELQSKIEVDAPYVKAAQEFFDDSGLLRYRDSARALGLPERQFIGYLRDWGWVDTTGTAAKAYAINHSYAKNIVFHYKGGATVTGKLTRKGLERASVKLYGAGDWV